LSRKKDIHRAEVQSNSSRTFQFVKINNGDKRLFCLQQNVLVLAWILFFKNDTLRPIIRPDNPFPFFLGVLHRIWDWVRSAKGHLNFLVKFIRCKYQRQRAEPAVHLPFYGNICVPVHRGYKIFDFRRGGVAKVFDPDVHSTSICREIDGLKKVSAFDFAPSLRRWNVEKKWYEEEFLSGVLDSSYKPLDSVNLLNFFFQELVCHLNGLISFEPPIKKSSLEYVGEIVGILDESRLAKCEATVKEFSIIKTFIDSTIERLCGEGNCPIFLVFSHGDFCPANMLNTRNGMKIIDWEGTGNRSVLFDAYSYFFYRPVSRKVPVPTLALEIKEALPFFISSLDKKAPHISKSLLQLKNVYRWIYYVEHICKEVEREATDKNLNILEDILGYIEAFSRYEEILALDDRGVKCVG